MVSRSESTIIAFHGTKTPPSGAHRTRRVWDGGAVNRWRNAATVLGLVALLCVVIALFTTFDSVQAGDTFCGSPVDPQSEALPACAEQLGHARATRTAALAWGMAALAGAWACDALRRRPPTADEQQGPVSWRF